MKDLRPTSSYLGIWITIDHNSRSIWIDQQVYIENAIKKFGLQDANSTKTPLPAALHLEKNEVMATIETKTLLQQMIGTLIYAAIGNRPDITFAATWLSQYNNNPLDSPRICKTCVEISQRHKGTPHELCWNGIKWDVFQLETEHSNKEFYQIIVQFIPVQMISCWLMDW